jgi:hypothetical protein
LALQLSSFATQSGVKQTSEIRAVTSPSDPKADLAGPQVLDQSKIRHPLLRLQLAPACDVSG